MCHDLKLKENWLQITDLYPSPDIIRVIKLRSMRWVGHVERMGDRRGACWGDLVERDHLKELGVNGRII
jgi:hypothetical protein